MTSAAGGPDTGPTVQGQTGARPAKAPPFVSRLPGRALFCVGLDGFNFYVRSGISFR